MSENKPFGIQSFQFDLEKGRWKLMRMTTDKRTVCQVRMCQRSKQVERTICATCHSREYRANNRAMYIFSTIRRNAKRRKVHFALTFADFMEAIDLTDYLALRGSSPISLQIDRIKSHLGYVPGNIQIIPAPDNIAKGNRERHFKPEPTDQQLPDDHDPY